MAIEPTNMARLCTAKWQPLWVKLDAHKYCQIFVSPYTGDYLYYYNNEWHNVGKSDMYYYDRTTWVKVTTEGLKLQYSNKVRDFSVTPATMYTVTLTVNDTDHMELDLNGTAFQSGDTISVPHGTSVSANGNVLTIGTNVITATVVTAGYNFITWWGEMFGPLPQAITEDTTLEAECSPGEPVSIVFQDFDGDDVDGLLEFYPIEEGAEDPRTGYEGNSYFTYNGDIVDLSLDLVNTAEGLSGVKFNTDFVATEHKGQYYATVSTDDTEHVGTLGYGGYVCKFNVVWQHNEGEPMTIGTLTVNINAGP